MYARTVETVDEGGEKSEQVLTFGVSGKLIMNVLVMFDRETESYWSQILGKAVEGSFAGTELTPIAALQTTWGEWKRLHPDTKALVTNGQGAYDTYSSYYRSNQAGVIGETREDTRLNRKDLITGIVVDEQPIAYPHLKLAETPVVNDTVDVGGTEEPLLVVYEIRANTAAVYSRRLGDQTLTFRLAQDSGNVADSFTGSVVDEETGTTWSLLTGTAVDGPLAGEQLTRIPSTTSFWFGWKDWYPETRVFGL